VELGLLDTDGDDLRSLNMADDGSLWFVSRSDGLWHYEQDGQLTHYTMENSSLPTNEFQSLAISGEHLWLDISGADGIVRYNPTTDESILLNPQNNPDIRDGSFNQPHVNPYNGDLWVDTWFYLYRITPSLEITEFLRSGIFPGGGFIKDFHFQGENNLLLAFEEGVYEYDGTDFSLLFQDPVAFHNISQVFQDSKGDIWFSDFGEDIMYVIRDENVFEFSSADIDGVPRQVFQLIEHQDTIMAVGTKGNNISKMKFFAGGVSTDDLSNINLEIFPNPVSDILQVRGATLGTAYHIFDIMGRTIMSGVIEDNFIRIEELEEGDYNLELRVSDGSKFVKGFVIMR